MLMVPEKREYPHFYLRRALDVFRERSLKSIVEIGCVRQPLNHPIGEFHIDCCAEGHSTMLWARETDDFVTVDITESSIELARNECKRHYGKDIDARATDGIKFLQSWSRPIDLLYLDAWDLGLPRSAEDHLAAFLAAENCLHDNSLVLIDDTDCKMIDSRLHFTDTGIEGKGWLVIPYAISKGWKVVFSGRQVLLSK